MATAQKRFLTLLFLDVPNVVDVREQMGVAGQQAFQQRCLSIVNLVRKQHGGVVVRSVGSTVLCAFERPEDAVRAACVLQETANGATNSGGKIPPVFRIGLHAGEVMLRNGGCVGEAVTSSSRIVTMAKSHQILATQDVYSRVSVSLQRQFLEVASANEAGSGFNLRLFEVIWRSDGKSVDPEVSDARPGSSEPDLQRLQNKTATAPLSVSKLGLSQLAVAPPVSAERPSGAEIKTHTRRTNRRIILKEIEPQAQAQVQAEAQASAPAEPLLQVARLCLLWQQKIIVVDNRRLSVSFGREEPSDIVVSVATASRHHADVEFREDGFFLTDHSWNGTFVYDEDGVERLLHNDEMKLIGGGVICPGCPASEEGAAVVRFIQAT